MDKLLNFPAIGKKQSAISCIVDLEISESIIVSVLEQNKTFFDLISKSHLGTTKFKFQPNGKQIIMRTFDKKGLEAATYYVKEDNTLFRYREEISNKEVFSNNDLKLVEYELQYKVKNYWEVDDENEDESGEMRFQLLNEKGLDPVGDSFSLDEGIEFINNANPIDYSYHSAFRAL